MPRYPLHLTKQHVIRDGFIYLSAKDRIRMSSINYQ